METIFAFEQAFAEAFQCIPMAVRYKLDLSGVKLSLQQWNRFTDDDRRDLLRHKCETAPEIVQFHDMLAGLITSRAGEAPRFLPVEAAPPWANHDAVPDQVIAQSQKLGIESPTPAQWRLLAPLQRFALFKLSQAGHENENFIPAMNEFRLLQSQG